MIVGTIFVAGSYGVGKSTLCDKLSKALGLPTYSAGDLISSINGEQYGANKAVQNKETNQDILAIEVSKKLAQHPTILLAGHFCIFDRLNGVDKLPRSVFTKLVLDQILLLEADPYRILSNLSIRDKKEYQFEHIQLLLSAERQMAQEVAKQCSCCLHIHQMSFDDSDLQKCMRMLALEGVSA